jgi:hypothetical protein
MATLRITRRSEYTNRLRGIQLYVDGKKMATIGNGETLDLELPAGDHILQAKIDWCSSPALPIKLEAYDTVSYQLESFAKTSSLGIFAAIYYITFGARKYLHLKKIS